MFGGSRKTCRRKTCRRKTCRRKSCRRKTCRRGGMQEEQIRAALEHNRAAGIRRYTAR